MNQNDIFGNQRLSPDIFEQINSGHVKTVLKKYDPIMLLGKLTHHLSEFKIVFAEVIQSVKDRDNFMEYIVPDFISDNIETIQWIHETYEISHRGLSRALFKACEQSKYNTAIWLTRQVVPTEKHFRAAIRSGNFELTSELYTMFECPKDTEMYTELFGFQYSRDKRNRLHNFIKFLNDHEFVCRSNLFSLIMQCIHESKKEYFVSSDSINNLRQSLDIIITIQDTNMISYQDVNIAIAYTNNPDMFWNNFSSVINSEGLLNACETLNTCLVTFLTSKGFKLSEYQLYKVYKCYSGKNFIDDVRKIHEILEIIELNSEQRVTDAISPDQQKEVCMYLINNRGNWRDYSINTIHYRLLLDYIIIYLKTTNISRELHGHMNKIQTQYPEKFERAMIHMWTNNLFHPYYALDMIEMAKEAYANQERRKLLRNITGHTIPRDLFRYYIVNYL